MPKESYMKSVFILLAILTSTSCFADYGCEVLEEIIVNGQASQKTNRSFNVVNGELKGIPSLRVATKSSKDSDGKNYKYDYLLDAGIMCQEGDDCKILGYLRATCSVKTSAKDEQFIGKLSKKHVVSIYGDSEQVFSLNDGNVSTILKIACAMKKNN